MQLHQPKLQQGKVFSITGSSALLWLLAPLAWSETASAQLLDLSLEELLSVEVVTTPRFAASPDDIPASVTIVRQVDFQRYGWRTVADMLRSLAGYVVTSDYTYSYATSRGLAVSGDYRSRTQILLDGIQINENIFDSVNIDQSFPLDISMIERVEVIRGPSASVYGGNSLFGVINVISRKSATINGIEAVASLASGDLHRASISAGKIIGGMEVTANFTAFSADGRNGFFPERAAAGLPAEANGLDAETGRKFMLRVTDTALRFSLYGTGRKKYIPTGSYGTIFNDSSHTETSTNILSELGYTRTITETVSLDNRVYYGYHNFDARYPYDYEPLIVVNRDKAYGRWWGAESSLAIDFSPTHQFIGGLEYRDNYTQSQTNEDVGYNCYDPPGQQLCLNSTYNSQRASVYVQDQFQISPLLLVTAGLRYDTMTDQVDKLSPRIGLVYKTSAGNFKYLFAEAYRYANPFERLYDLPSYPSANASLRPEEMRSHELTWDYQLNDNTSLVSTYYQYRLDNFIGTDASSLLVNTVVCRVNGLEFTLNGALSPVLDYTLSYATQRTEGAGKIQVLPHQMLKLNLALQLPLSGLSSGLEWQVYSERSTVVPNGQIPGFGLMNFNLHYQPPQQLWTVQAGIRDLLDKANADPIARDDYMDPARDRILQLGRSWYAEFTWRF